MTSSKDPSRWRDRKSAAPAGLPELFTDAAKPEPLTEPLATLLSYQLHGALRRRLDGSHRADDELVEAARRGEMRAKDSLVQRYSRMVLRIASRLAGRGGGAQDVVQDVFLHAFANLDKLNTPEAFQFWIAKMTVHLAARSRRNRATHLRWEGARSSSSVSFCALATSAPPDVEVELSEIRREVDKLPPRHRTAFLLRRVDGMTLAEIAFAMGASLASVKRWVGRSEIALLRAIAVPPSRAGDRCPTVGRQ
jgi:RNA polymerase sigma-70 factor, ECF subfamily